MGVLEIIGWGIGAIVLGYLRIRKVSHDEFFEEHGEEIDAQNEKMFEAWQRENPDKKRLLIEREYKLPWRPRIKVRRTFRN